MDLFLRCTTFTIEWETGKETPLISYFNIIGEYCIKLDYRIIEILSN